MVRLFRVLPFALSAALALFGAGCGGGDGVVPRSQRPQPVAALPQGLQAVTAGEVLARARANKSGVRGLVVNVWASWCGSCREEVPLLLKVRDAVAGRGLPFAFVSADQPQDFAKAVEQLRGWGVALPGWVVAPGSMGDFKRSMSPSWRGGIPATFLFDAKGQLRHAWEGPILEEEIAPKLEAYLAGQNVDGLTRTAAEPATR